MPAEKKGWETREEGRESIRRQRAASNMPFHSDLSSGINKSELITKHTPRAQQVLPFPPESPFAVYIFIGLISLRAATRLQKRKTFAARTRRV